MKRKVKKVCGWCGREYTGNPKSKWCGDVCKMRAYRSRLKINCNVTNQQ